MKQIKLGIKLTYIIVITCLIILSAVILLDTVNKYRKSFKLSADNKQSLQIISQVKLETEKANEVIDYLTKLENKVIDINLKHNPFKAPVLLKPQDNTTE